MCSSDLRRGVREGEGGSQIDGKRERGRDRQAQRRRNEFEDNIQLIHPRM